MTLDDLLHKYDVIHGYFKKNYPEIEGEYELLARLTKIAEEYGELVSATHGKLHLHRQDKQATFSEDEVAKEWVDLLSTVMLFGKVAGIDRNKAIRQRLDELYQRYQLND